MYCPTPNKAKKAFTLVEVLMVLVIISIMAGLLITVINPVRQRARARDGTIIATANKIVATVNAFNSATGIFPTCPELLADLQNATILVACTANEGTIDVSGITFPATCEAATRYAAAGTSACGFRYERNAAGDAACLGSKLHSDENLDDTAPLGTYLLWTSAQGRFTDTPLAGGGTCNL